MTYDSREVAINAGRLLTLRERIDAEVSVRLPSAQFAVARHGTLIAFETLGDPGTPASEPRYLLQSVGRTIVASAIWKLISDGLVDVNESVAGIIPEFGANEKELVTVEHVLTHTGGFPYAPLGYPKMADRSLRLEAFSKWRLDEPPGSTLQFHLTSAAWLIAEIVERRGGMPLPEYLRTQIAEPLGLGFALAVSESEQRDTIAPMRCTDGDGSEVDPWGPWYLNNPAVVACGEPAHSVVGTAADVAMHYQSLLAVRTGQDGLWTQETVLEATRAHVTAKPAGEAAYGGGSTRTSVGWFVIVAAPDFGGWMPTHSGPATFGHGGAAYQLGFADPDTGLSFAMLSNGYPTSGYDNSQSGRDFISEVANMAADLTRE